MKRSSTIHWFAARWLAALAVAAVVVVTVRAFNRLDTQQIATAIQQVVASDAMPGVPAQVWADVRMFYTPRTGAPAWTVDTKLAKADQVLQLIRSAPEDALVAADYSEPQLTQMVDAARSSGSENAQQLAELDVRLTASALALARDVALGRIKPQTLDAKWKHQRIAPDFVTSLNASVNGDLRKWIASVRPAHPEYAGLQKALLDLYAIQKKGGWPRVPARSLKVGATGAGAAALRQRLAATGFLDQAAAGAQPASYDKTVEAGVRAFQEHHGLKPTGIADTATITALNVPIGARIHQVAMNMERWRWLPDDFGARHILVNVPAYLLLARENGRPVMSMKVVVGKADEQHATPIFSAPMKTVVFSPHWNIPDTIVEGETIPAVMKDPNYLTKNDIEILKTTKGGTQAIDPSSIDWSDTEAVKSLSFRQKPGESNALGHVKFLMPNDFDVYLHDTPADSLFARNSRAFSHGCIRVEEPEALAKYVLRDMPEWTDEQIHAAEMSGVEKAVQLTQPIPVHIVYFTAWTNDDGTLQFAPDIYGFDRVK